MSVNPRWRAQAQLEQVEKFFKAGIVSEYDLLRAEVQVSSTKPAVIGARNQLELAEASLRHLIGVEQGTPIIIQGDFQADTADLPATAQEAMALALRRRPDIQAAEYWTQMQDEAIITERSKGRPRISLSAGYQVQSQMNDDRLRKTAFKDFIRSWNTQVLLNYDLFDGGENNAKVTRAEVGYQQAEYQERQLKSNVKIQVTRALLRLKDARERLAAEQATVRLAERGLSIAQIRYEHGMGTQLEVLDAQQIATLAQTNYATALHDHAVAVFETKHAMGMLMPDIIPGE